MQQALRLIEQYGLIPHPEGGYYKETYRSKEEIVAEALPARFGGVRSCATAIYFLLEAGQFSAFHRIQSDELWHFYAGGALDIHVLHPDGGYTLVCLGNDAAKGEVFQALVPAGCWFASVPARGTAFALVGCTVSPGFDFADFEMAGAAALAAAYPGREALVHGLCRLP